MYIVYKYYYCKATTLGRQEKFQRFRLGSTHDTKFNLVGLNSQTTKNYTICHANISGWMLLTYLEAPPRLLRGLRNRLGLRDLSLIRLGLRERDRLLYAGGLLLLGLLDFDRTLLGLPDFDLLRGLGERIRRLGLLDLLRGLRDFDLRFGLLDSDLLAVRGLLDLLHGLLDSDLFFRGLLDFDLLLGLLDTLLAGGLLDFDLLLSGLLDDLLCGLLDFDLCR